MNSSLLSNAKATDTVNDLGHLLLRLWVGQEFLLAGYTKLSAGIYAPEWFRGLNFPVPLDFLSADVNWVMAGTGEVVLSLALILGFFSRFAALGLIFITYVAVYSVHFDLGWAGWNQIETDMGLGFKLPLMLGIMLAVLALQGGGKYTLEKMLATQLKRSVSEHA